MVQHILLKRMPPSSLTVALPRLVSPIWSIPILAFLVFFGAMLWANWHNPFVRKWFTLKTADHESFKCIAVLPKPMRQYPVVVYAHGWGGNITDDGTELREIAELGLAAVGLEYNQTNYVAFSRQFEALLNYLRRQKWVNKHAIAWAGLSLGANRMLHFAVQYPREQPQLLVQLSGAGIGQLAFDSQNLTNLFCPVLLVHGSQDETFPLADNQRLAEFLQSKGTPVKLKIIAGAPHGMRPYRGELFRAVGEYCLTDLSGKNAWRNYRSIAEWDAQAPPLWEFCVPAIAWAIGLLVWRWCHRASSVEKLKSRRHGFALRWVAVVLASCALMVTSIQLVTPQFLVNNRSLFIARRFLVPSNERADFKYLASQPMWRSQKLKVLLAQVELASYNRELVDWQLDEKIYKQYVLSPIINPSTSDSQSSISLGWRRALWEEFYPRVRYEKSLEVAAQIVVRHLRARVTVTDFPKLPHDVPSIWQKQMTDKNGFEIVYVAALRSVGIPSQLDSHGYAQIFCGSKWRSAPRPTITSW